MGLQTPTSMAEYVPEARQEVSQLPALIAGPLAYPRAVGKEAGGGHHASCQHASTALESSQRARACFQVADARKLKSW